MYFIIKEKRLVILIIYQRYTIYMLSSSSFSSIELIIPLMRYRLYLLLYCTIFIKQKIPFRYDWKKVVTSVLEFMISKRNLAQIQKRIALIGICRGGYLAVGLLYLNHRISAVILYNGVYDGYDSIKSGFLKSLLDAIEEGNSEFVNMIIYNLMESKSNIKFNIKHEMWTTGTSSPYELISQLRNIQLKIF